MHSYALHIAYTRSGLRIVNTHTRIRASAPPVSVSLPRACRFSCPCSLRVRYVNLTRSFAQQLPLRWHTFLRKQTHAPDIRGMRAGGLVHLRWGQGKTSVEVEMSARQMRKV